MFLQDLPELPVLNKESEKAPIEEVKKNHHVFENFKFIGEDEVLNYDLLSQNTYDSFFEEEREEKSEERSTKAPRIKKI